ncbi:MAG: putative DNA binding domain-containing protein [Candidatus Sericytochromatia bacterium]|nr:putative DNA binding domain-containing protein [Candidatus Sericytochromatia bacterium]
MLDLISLNQQPEGQYSERKSLWHGPANNRKVRDRKEVRDQIAEYVAAFANADGGVLVLGVEDDGAVTGHGYPPDAVELMLTVPTQRLNPPMAAGVRVDCQGKEVLVFEVDATEQAVMVVGNGFPRRVDDKVMSESEEAINAIKQRSRVESIERQQVPDASIDSLDEDRIRRAAKAAGLGHLEPADYLYERHLADYRSGKLVLRKGALLLFAKRARDIDHPNAGVRIFRVDGTVRLTGAAHNVQALPRIEGSLPDVIERTYGAVNGLIRKSTRLHDLFFREVPEYPTFAWQEAIVNAIAHRDYRNQGNCVEVWIFDDRMEIVSPGALPETVDVEMLRRREPIHISRNPLLTRVLSELALMREQGEGIPRMFAEMEQSWLPLPTFKADESRFTVILGNEPIFETPDPEWLRYVHSLPISYRQRRSLVAFGYKKFSNGDYQQLNQVNRDTAYRDLKELVDLGYVTAPAKTGRGAEYQVNPMPKAKPIPPPATNDGPSPRHVLASQMTAAGWISNADYRQAFAVDSEAASAELASLTAHEVLVREGQRRWTRYRPGPGWDAWVYAAQSPP